MFPRSLSTFKLSVLFSLIFFLFAFSRETYLKIYYGVHKDKIRIVLKSLSRKPLKYRVFSLKGPYRIVIDLRERVRIRRVFLPRGFRYRVGKHSWGTRLVIIPKRNYRYTHFTLRKPYRIVLDLKKKSRVRTISRKLLKSFEKKVVVVDPGHGGKDPGAIGYRRIKEKWVNLRIARYLAEFLRKDGRFKVIMTRYGDYYVSLGERVRIARRHKADLFISIHSDAAPRGKRWARGTQIFVLSRRSAYRKKRELMRNTQYAFAIFRDARNARAIPILSDIGFEITLNRSREFARLLARELKRDMGRRQIIFKGIRSRGFAVLKTPGTISVLVETGFITNPYEARKLTDRNFQRRFAYSLYKAIVKYFYGN